MSVLVENGYTTESFIPGLSYSIPAAKVPPTVVNLQIQTLKDLPRKERSDFELHIPGFDTDFGFEITDIDWSLDSRVITLHASLGGQISIEAILTGEWAQDAGAEETFRLDNFGLNLKEKAETPLAVYVASTMWALLGLGLSFKVRIPELEYDFDASVELPLNQISSLLQERQIAYRLMVISSATGIPLPFPVGFIDGKDVENIAFCYHAIVDREFDWPTLQSTIPWEANTECLAWLPDDPKPKEITFRPELVVKPIFETAVPLGLMTGRIEKAVIDNYEDVKEGLSKLDGSVVDVKLRSTTGLSRMISVTVPKLLPNPWSLPLKALFGLDEQINRLTLEKYFNLATKTLEGLGDGAKKAVTPRPELDEEAFDI